MLGETGDFRFVSDSDVVVTVKVNGEVVQLDADGKFSYTPDVVGNLTIDIHATNGGNTDTDFTLTVPVVKVELISDKHHIGNAELVHRIDVAVRLFDFKEKPSVFQTIHGSADSFIGVI